MSADTARLASQHHKLGKPGGPGLFGDKSMQLPAYIQNVAQALVRNGKTKSQAIQIAIGTVKRWASGQGDVSPEVRAAAAKAVAEWEALKAKARATPNKADLANEATDVTDGMGMIALEVPAGAIPALPGGTAQDDMHVTLCFMGKSVTDAQLAQAIMRAYDAASRPPLSGTVGGLGVFPPDEDGMQAVWATLDVPGLDRLQQSVSGYGMPASDHGFVPHITRALVKVGDKLPAPLPQIPITFTQLIVKRGDQVFRFPLGGGDSPERASAYATARAAAIELAAPAKKDDKGKPAKGDKQSAKFGEPDLPPGATGWKHGWIPVDSSGKAVGPAQKPKWLLDDEKKHLAAGGKTADQIRGDAAAAEFKRKADKAAAPGKKAAAAKKAADKKAASEAKSKTHAAEVAARKKALAERKAERAKTSAQKAKDRQIQAAYKQALADQKAGRAFTPQQKRVVAYVTAQNAKKADASRKVDVPGQKVGSSVTVNTAVKPATVTKTAAAKAKAAVSKSAPKVKSKSYKNAASRATALAQVPWGVNVIDLAGKHPAGQLAFRYKHNWILINPAIPSRGRMGGGLAVQHGHKSGTVTHGHFEPHPSGKGKVFVADRTGGKIAAQKLAELHAKKSAPHMVGGKVNYTKPEQSKYKLAAVGQAPKGDALNPTTPSPATAKAKSDAANAASATASKSKSVADAQVAAKKHADAFVANKKAGNTAAAESHKSNAQAWAKKAQQLKGADKATKDAKAKYEAEQKSKADSEKALAEKAEAEQKLKQAKSEHAGLKADAIGAYGDAFSMPQNTAEEKLAKAAAFDNAAKKAGAVIQHGAKNDLPEDKLTAAKLTQSQELKKELEGMAATQKKADEAKFGKASSDATEFSLALAKSNIANSTDHEAAAKKHAEAALMADQLGMKGIASLHKGEAEQHKNAAKVLKDAEAGPGPGIKKANTAGDISAAVDYAASGLDDDVPGELFQWDDYLQASAAYKLNPTPANLKKMSAAQKVLTAKGVTTSDLQVANKNLYKKLGVAKPVKKAVSSTPPKAPEAAPVAVPEINLPGPGMYKDGLAIKNAQSKYDGMSASPEKEALGKAISNAKAKFQSKHGLAFKEDKAGAEVGVTNTPFVPYGDHVKENPLYADAKKNGYEPVSLSESANGDWKPSQVPGLKSKAGAYHYSGGSYTVINQQLRKHKSPTGGTNDKAIAQMDKEFAAVPGLDHGIVVTRKMNDKGPFPASPPPMEPGAVFKDWGYSSTSKDPDVWSGNVVMTVQVPKGTKVLDLNNTTGSQHSSEQEILLDRGTHYKIESDVTVGGTRKITVTVVPGPKD